MSFRIGQKVVCIRTFVEIERAAGLGVILPRKGIVYTVRGFDPWNGLYDRPSGLLLEEIINAVRYWANVDGYGEASYMASYFRPIIERSTETGMTILRRICADHKQPIRERV